jgi:hypothetical protein
MRFQRQDSVLSNDYEELSRVETLSLYILRVSRDILCSYSIPLPGVLWEPWDVTCLVFVLWLGALGFRETSRGPCASANLRHKFLRSPRPILDRNIYRLQ